MYRLGHLVTEEKILENPAFKYVVCRNMLNLYNYVKDCAFEMIYSGHKTIVNDSDVLHKIYID